MGRITFVRQDNWCHILDFYLFFHVPTVLIKTIINFDNGYIVSMTKDLKIGEDNVSFWQSVRIIGEDFSIFEHIGLNFPNFENIANFWTDSEILRIVPEIPT